jgi:hypothetical protein
MAEVDMKKILKAVEVLMITLFKVFVSLLVVILAVVGYIGIQKWASHWGVRFYLMWWRLPFSITEYMSWFYPIKLGFFSFIFGLEILGAILVLWNIWRKMVGLINSFFHAFNQVRKNKRKEVKRIMRIQSDVGETDVRKKVARIVWEADDAEVDASFIAYWVIAALVVILVRTTRNLILNFILPVVVYFVTLLVIYVVKIKIVEKRTGMSYIKACEIHDEYFHLSCWPF